MGANWVPCEPFPSEEANQKITQILTLAKNCGMNIIRVWGGGIPEKEHFYNECDHLGVRAVSRKKQRIYRRIKQRGRLYHKKAAYYAFRNAAKPIMLSIDDTEGRTILYLCNNTDKAVSLEITLDYLDYTSNTVLQSKQISLAASAQSVISVPVDAPFDNQIVFAQAAGITSFYKRGGCLIKKCKKPEILAQGKNFITLKSSNYIHAVELLGIKKPCDNFFAMLPNKEYTVSFEDADNITINAYTPV